MLFGITVGLTIAQAHLLWEDNERFISDMSSRLDLARTRFVTRHEKRIKFGNAGRGPWVDVEADEVDLGKEAMPCNGSGVARLRWEQWACYVEYAGGLLGGRKEGYWEERGAVAY